jgi:hypothetical protein
MSNNYPQFEPDETPIEPLLKDRQRRGSGLEKISPASFSIKTLFQITTASALFFACLRISPILAIAITVFVAPAIIRTGLISEIYRRNDLPFGLATRLNYFVNSIGIVVLALTIGGVAFLSTSLLFGLFGMVFSTLVGSSELSTDAAVIGTAGGMVWGMAAAMLTIGFAVMKTWIPKRLLAKT